VPVEDANAATSAAKTIAGLEFHGRWRHYQTLALAAFQRDADNGRRRTHIVAPPGSGKTLLGVEIVRRLAAPALVLVPNTAVQQQWLAAVRRFTGGADRPDVAAADPSAPIAVLSYQSLCRLDDPAAVLGDLAVRRWTAERAAATGQSPDEVEAEAEAWTGEARRRRDREIRRISAALKREIARAEHGALHLGRLLSGGARARLDALRANGVRTIVLDECHHLASLWGYVVRTVVEELGDAHLVGLTATPPGELTRDEAELYAHLLGPVDFTVPTPAVVRERYLAPYQELAWFTRPLDAEARWLAEHDVRFRELVTTLHGDASGPLSFPEWVLTRLRERGLGSGRGGEDAAISWPAFQRRHPALARAGARFIVTAGLPLPGGMPRGEGYREQPGLADWLVLLEDYTLRCLRADPSPDAAARYEAIAAALRELGFTLTRQGIRRGTSDVDRLLTGSAAKSIALTEVVACEYEARGAALRALVLTDTERSQAAPAGSLLGVLRPEAGTAPEAVRVLAADGRTAPLRPLLVSGRGLRCAEGDADGMLAALAARAPAGLTGWHAEPAEDAAGLVRLAARGADWQSRVWVGLATEAFAAGETRVLVGTRAMLGEGWDSPRVNCLVDMSAATTSVSVTQMRGRSLRLDPADPDKIASNWDIVCVAPELARGDADYDRFVRKHRHLFAPSEDGVIEAGPSHVHPSLSPFAPPPAAEFAEINRAMAGRAREHTRARERWAIGEPYLAEEHETLVVRGRRGPRPGRTEQRTEQRRERPPDYPVRQRAPLALAGVAAAMTAVCALATWPPGALAGLAAVSAALGWAYARLARAGREIQDAVPLDLVAYAIRDAYHELGELSDDAAGSLAIEPRASGYLRVWLKRGTPAEGAVVTAALHEVVDPDGFPRYLVSRLVPHSRRPVGALWRTLTFRPPFGVRWSPLPADLGRRKNRAEVYARCWRRWVGPSELRFTQRSDEGKEALAAAGAQAADYEARTRRVWL
jgi:superfamily II DNA or RNA helicase